MYTLRPLRPADGEPNTLEPLHVMELLNRRASVSPDGQADEAKALAQHCPWLIDELYDLFVRSVRHDGGSIDAELSQAILGWRVVGVPKRAPAESRRIAIASVLLRAWHRTVADTLPQLPEQQWSELGFGRVFSNLLEFQGLNDAEVDEEKAFDMIQHEVAKIALLFGGAPNIVAE